MRGRQSRVESPMTPVEKHSLENSCGLLGTSNLKNEDLANSKYQTGAVLHSLVTMASGIKYV